MIVKSYACHCAGDSIAARACSFQLTELSYCAPREGYYAPRRAAGRSLSENDLVAGGPERPVGLIPFGGRAYMRRVWRMKKMYEVPWREPPPSIRRLSSGSPVAAKGGHRTQVSGSGAI